MTREEARRYTPTDLWLSDYPPLPAPTTSPTLRLSGLAYLKLLTWRNATSNEVCCYGLCHPDDALFIVDMILPDQLTQPAYCTPHEDHLLHLMENLLPLGIEPWRWASHWFHTHPAGMGPSPSSTDNTTFNSTRYTACDHSFMAIFGGNNEFSCRLRHRSAVAQLPPTILEIPTHVHLSYLPPTLTPSTWLSLYSALTYTVDPDSPRHRITYQGITDPIRDPSTTKPDSDHRSLYSALGSLSHFISDVSRNTIRPRVFFNDAILTSENGTKSPDDLIIAVANLPVPYEADLNSNQIQVLADALLDPELEEDVLWAIPNMIEADIRTLARTANRYPNPLEDYTNALLKYRAQPSLGTLEFVPRIAPPKPPLRATPIKESQ